jgi:CRISPR-associated exonuclease Cas4
VPFGEVFYFGSRRRRRVELDEALRARTAQVIERAFALAEITRLPPPTEPWSKCQHCSLEPLCLPRETRQLAQVKAPS